MYVPSRSCGQRPAASGRGERVDDGLGWHVLEEVTGGSRFDGPEDFGVAVEGRKDQHRWWDGERAQGAGSRDTVHALAEAQIAQHDIGAQVTGECDSFLAGCGLAYHPGVIGGVDDGA